MLCSDSQFTYDARANWNVTRERRIYNVPVSRYILSLTLCGLCHSSETDGGISYPSLFLHIVTTLLSPTPLTLFVACHRGKFRGGRPPWNFLIRQIRICLFANAMRRRTPRGFSDDASHPLRRETMDQRITTVPIGCTLFPLDPGYRTYTCYRRARQSDGRSNDDDAGEKARKRDIAWKLRFSDFDLFVYFFPLVSSCFFCEKIRMSEETCCRAGTRWHLRERSSIGGRKKNSRSFLSLFVLSYCTWNEAVQLTRANIPNKSILNQS